MGAFQNLPPKEGASGGTSQPPLVAPPATGSSSFNEMLGAISLLLLVGTVLLVWRKIGPPRFVFAGGLGGSALFIVLAIALGPGGPSSTEVSAGVASVLSRSQGINSLTGTNICGVSTAPVTSLRKVEVLERGDRNAQGNYWPLRVSIAGTCKEQMPNCGPHQAFLCDPVEKPFEAILSLRFSKGDYGKWNAFSVPR